MAVLFFLAQTLRIAIPYLFAAAGGVVTERAGLIGGALLALVYGVSAIRFRADQVVTGIAINLLAIGLTRFFLRLAFGSSSTSPRVPGFGGEHAWNGFA